MHLSSPLSSVCTLQQNTVHSALCTSVCTVQSTVVCAVVQQNNMSNFSDLKYFPIASQITNRKDHIHETNEKQREGEEVELFSTLIILKLSMVTQDVPLFHHQKENHVTTGPQS